MDIAFAFPMSQLYAWAAAAIVTLAILAMALRALERFHARRLDAFIDANLAPRLLSGVDARLRRPMFWFTLSGFGFLALALAEPHWGQSWDQVTRRSHDIIVCLDTSESMLAKNPLPNRLERAKQKIGAIVDRAFGDRFALVAFSGAAELMCPLTLDHGYYRTILAAVTTDSIGLEGSNLAAALKVAMATFQDQDAEADESSKGSRAIILVSDGEQVSGDVLEVAREASQYARIHVIGVGDPRGVEIAYRNRFARGVKLSEEDRNHVSRLDEATLRRIAEVGHGGYARARADNSDVDEIFDLIQELFAKDVEGDIRRQLVNRFQWPLAAGILCFAGEGAWLALLPWIRWWRERRRDAAGEEGEYA